MAAPPIDDSAVHLRLKLSDAEDFIHRFAPNVTRGGIFLPTHDTREVGSAIRFEILLLDKTVMLAGEGVVTWAKPKGLGVKFKTLDPATAPMLERLLDQRQAVQAALATTVAAEEARPTPVSPLPAMQASAEAARSTRARVQGRSAPARAKATPVPVAVAVGMSQGSLALRPKRDLTGPLIVVAAVIVGV